MKDESDKLIFVFGIAQFEHGQTGPCQRKEIIRVL
eukprot:IDg7713t1